GLAGRRRRGDPGLVEDAERVATGGGHARLEDRRRGGVGGLAGGIRSRVCGVLRVEGGRIGAVQGGDVLGLRIGRVVVVGLGRCPVDAVLDVGAGVDDGTVDDVAGRVRRRIRGVAGGDGSVVLRARREGRIRRRDGGGEGRVGRIEGRQ